MYDKYDESIYTCAVDIWSLGMTMLNVYINDYSNELYTMSDLKHKISNKDYSHIELNKHINTLVVQDSSNAIDSAMALLFTKILCINPDERIV